MLIAELNLTIVTGINVKADISWAQMTVYTSRISQWSKEVKVPTGPLIHQAFRCFPAPGLSFIISIFNHLKFLAFLAKLKVKFRSSLSAFSISFTSSIADSKGLGTSHLSVSLIKGCATFSLGYSSSVTDFFFTK